MAVNHTFVNFFRICNKIKGLDHSFPLHWFPSNDFHSPTFFSSLFVAFFFLFFFFFFFLLKMTDRVANQSTVVKWNTQISVVCRLQPGVCTSKLTFPLGAI